MLILNSGNMKIKDERFIIGEYINKIHIIVTTIRFILETLNFNLLNISPEKAPTNPAAAICQNVHGPCPKNMFDINILIDPIKKDSAAPKNIDDRIIIEVSGLMQGIK
jgi:hypothetical protein